jgi:Mg-chelatase subunit ChlD
MADELLRATARRGALDVFYQELSDHWTAIMQNLHPVWLLIGPGLSDPGHIEMRSRTVYLDSRSLLGDDTALRAGTITARAVLRTFGVALHETYHAKHSKQWVLDRELDLQQSDDPDDRTLGRDMGLLEEPRMEAHGLRDHAAGSRRARFAQAALQACAIDVLIPAFIAQLVGELGGSGRITRDNAGWTMMYLHGRVPSGVLHDTHLAAVRRLWIAALGQGDHDRVCELIDRVVWVPDGDIPALETISREYRDIIGPPDGDPSDSGAGAASGQPDDGHSGAGGDLTDAIEEACQHAAAALDAQIDSSDDLRDVTDHASSDPPDTRQVDHSKAPPSGRQQDRGVNRPPYADEQQAARNYANALRRALTAGTVRIDKRTPGGRFNGRAWARGVAERQAGRPVSARPWEIQREARNPIRAPHVALLIDTSGSMSMHEAALGPIVWMLNEGLRAVDGRVAVVLFGDGCQLLSDGSRPMALVPGITTGGGHELVARGLQIACEQLDMTDQRRPRFAYMVGDGHWVDREQGVLKVRELRAHGVPSIHIGIGQEPWAVEADRTTVISDPVDLLTEIARDTVDALNAASRRRR